MNISAFFVGLAAVTFYLLCYQQKKRNNIIIFNAISRRACLNKWFFTNLRQRPLFLPKMCMFFRKSSNFWHTKLSSLFYELFDLPFWVLRRFYLMQKLPLTIGYRLVVQFLYVVCQTKNKNFRSDISRSPCQKSSKSHIFFQNSKGAFNLYRTIYSKQYSLLCVDSFKHFFSLLLKCFG